MSGEDEVDWEQVATPVFISAKQMIVVCLVLEMIVGGMFIVIADKFDIPSTDVLWWVLQFFGLVVATNLGAVILAIMAQKTANDIGIMYRAVFTPEFYLTLHTMTRFRLLVVEEAESEGKTLDEEMSDISVKLYRIIRAQLDVRANDITPIEPLNEEATEEELFG